MAKGAFGAQVDLAAPTAAASGTPSTSVTGLSSQRVLFGSSDGRIAQSANFNVNSSGHVGIGTTSPITALEIIHPGNGLLTLSTASGQQQFDLRITGGTLGVARTGITVDLFLNSGGNFGVGVTPAAKLHAQTTVNGNAFLVTATTAGTQPAFSIESTGSTSKIGFWTTAGSTRLSVTTVVPAAVYTSEVGREVNQIVEALRAFGLLT